MKRISLLAVLLVSASAAFGQTGLATITGTVSDPSGAAVANAPIEVHNLENGSIFKGASSDTGNFSVTQLPVGDYEVTVSVAGFKKYSHTKFHLAADQTLREDVTLQVGQSTESVTVTAEASLLQTETSELAGNFTIKQLDDLPLLTVGATNDGVRDYFRPLGSFLEFSIAIVPPAPEAEAATPSQSPSSTELPTIHFRLGWMGRS